jgi:hypothetical protein
MYSLLKLLETYKNNKHVINAYINKHKIENYDDYKECSSNFLILGMKISTFLILLLINIIIFIWAIIILVKYWNILPSWSQIIGIIGLFTGFGPLLTIIVVYIGKNVKNN